METKTTPRIPNEENGIQYNHCKNPKCLQFGVPVSQEKKYGGNTYNLTGVTKGGIVNIPHAKCNCCGDIFPLKSNKGIAEEIDRLYSYLKEDTKVYSCTNPDCSNHSVPVGTKKAYISFGTTASGSKRYRCNVCKKTFITETKATKGQHDTHKNIELFKLLMNKMPLSRIVNVLDISWHALYNKIDFIHRQCVAFASNREKQLKDMPIRRLYLALDRQEYSVNWTERKDKRNV
jgi:transposase-like protein